MEDLLPPVPAPPPVLTKWLVQRTLLEVLLPEFFLPSHFTRSDDRVRRAGGEVHIGKR